MVAGARCVHKKTHFGLCLNICAKIFPFVGQGSFYNSAFIAANRERYLAKEATDLGTSEQRLSAFDCVLPPLTSSPHGSPNRHTPPLSAVRLRCHDAQTVGGLDPLVGFGIEESDGTDPSLRLVLGGVMRTLLFCFVVALSDCKSQINNQF